MITRGSILSEERFPMRDFLALSVVFLVLSWYLISDCNFTICLASANLLLFSLS